MTSGTAIRQGLSLAQRARTGVWILFFANLGLAVLASYPIYWGVRAFTSHSAMSEDLATGFSFDWLTDFAVNNPGSLEPLRDSDRHIRAPLYSGPISACWGRSGKLPRT